jgi:hypothetical protein
MNSYALAFMPPSWHARAAANEAAARKRRCKTGPKFAWDPLALRWAATLVVDHKTFAPPTLWPDAPVVPRPDHVQIKKLARFSPAGTLAYGLVRLPKATPLHYHQGHRRGEAYFDGPVLVPTLWHVGAGQWDSGPWASVTPMECLTQLPLLRRAKGRVMVGGLGIGWFLSEVCRRPQVTDVLLVEKDEEVIRWLWPRVVATYPHVRDKVEVVTGDALDSLEPSAADGRVCLLDIWKGYGDAKWDKRFQAVKKKFPQRVFGWGDVHTEKERAYW